MADKYANKFLDAVGVKYLWDKAEGIYVKKEEGKTLSDENFTTEEKEKLASLTAYELPNASPEVLGGVKIGVGLAIDENGVVSATGEAIADVDALSFIDLDVITKSPRTEESLIASLAEGGDITLMNDVVVSQTISITENVTLDLNGHMLTADFSGYMFVVDAVKFTIMNGHVNSEHRIAEVLNGGTITVINGEYTSKDVSFASVGVNSRVEINGGEVTSNTSCIGVFGGAMLLVRGGVITSTDNYAIYTSHSDAYGLNNIAISGGTIVCQTNTAGKASCGVLIANKDNFLMIGGEIISTNGCGLLMRSGSATIKNGSISAYGSDNGLVGDVAEEMSNSAIIFHQTTNYPNKSSMRLTIEGGTFTGTDHSIEILSDESTPQVTVTGGNFIPEYL